MNNNVEEYTLSETANVYAKSVLKQIKELKSLTLRTSIKKICDLLISYIKDYKKILDKTDLLVFRHALLTISEFVNKLSLASCREKINWELPLIQECYRLCNVDFSKREILIINSASTDDYKVYCNVTKYLYPRIIAEKDIDKPIDIFVIPIEADYDITNISMLGHEIGHLVLTLNFGEIEKLILKFTGDDQKSFYEYSDAKKLSKYIQEYLCDYIGEYLFGPIFDIALIRSFCSIPTIKKEEPGNEHPSENSRIKKSFENIKNFKSNLDDINEAINFIKNSLKIFLEGIESNNSNNEIDLNLLKQGEKITEEIYKKIRQNLKASINIEKNWIKIKNELDSFRPPFEEVNDKIPNIFSPLEILIAVSIYFTGNVFKSKNEYFIYSKKSEEEKIEIIKETLIKHMRYVIGLFNVVKIAYKNYTKKLNIEESGLSETLWKFRKRISGEKPSPIVIVPTLDPLSQYSHNSIDLRLGTSFLIHKSTRYGHMDPLEMDNKRSKKQSLDEFYNKYELQVSDEFILHPHQFLLASSLEYISLPFDYFGLVLGRSTWGRLGLNIATATMVQPGFKGCLTLELRNLGETPLPLTVGVRIAQLCIIPAAIKNPLLGYFVSNAKYICPVSAELPKVKDDSDIVLLKKLKKILN